MVDAEPAGSAAAMFCVQQTKRMRAATRQARFDMSPLCGLSPVVRGDASWDRGRLARIFSLISELKSGRDARGPSPIILSSRRKKHLLGEGGSVHAVGGE